MSRFPRVELSSGYTFVSAAMKEGLEKIIGQDYAAPQKIISQVVLSDAQQLFDYAMKVINGQSVTPKESTGWLIVLDHLRATNPQKYKDKDNRLLYQDVRNLVSLMDNLRRLEKVPEDQRRYVPVLQRFFELLSQTGENARYGQHMSGEYTGKYSYELC